MRERKRVERSRTAVIALAFLSGLVAVAAILFILARPAVPVHAALNTGPVSAPAADLTVCPAGPPDCDYASVQDAVDAANDGDVIKVAAGTYTDVQNIPSLNTDTFTATQVVVITKSVTIRGGYTTTNWTTSDSVANPTTLDAQGQGRVLYITGSISPTVEGLRITGGNADGLGSPWGGYEHTGGGIYVVNAAATIKDNLVFSNTAFYAGGLYLIESASTLMGNTISGNTASMAAGLYLSGSDATLSGNSIVSNTASHIGGLYSHNSDATLVNNTITANIAETGYGGGLFLGRGKTTIDGNMITANTARKGGGLYIWDCDDPAFAPLLVNNIVADNHAGDHGSGLFISGCSPRLLHNTIVHNTGGDGSGIYVTWWYWAETYSNVAMTNTILVSHTVGISVTGGNTVTVNGVLWYDTPINISQAATAIVTVQNQREGDPAFAPDGHHLTASSAAIDKGVDAGVTVDIDDELRPAGDGYDLGADEFPAALTVTKQATPDLAQAGEQLTYTIRVNNTGNVELHATIIDTLPAHVTPTGILTWTPTITAPGGVWTETVVVTVEEHYEGPLTNLVKVTTEEGATGDACAIVNPYKVYLPVVLRQYQ